MRAGAVTAVVAVAATGLAGCGGSAVPIPPSGPHTGDEHILVPYPFPAARPELIPQPTVPGENAVWVDGEWEWKGSRWMWLSGRWEPLYPGAYWAIPTIVYLGDGRLAWFRGSWHAPEDRAAAKR